TYDVTVAAALGDLDGVTRMLDNAPSRIQETRPSGRRPLATAVEFGDEDMVRLLLDRGTDPCWDEPGAPHGTTLHKAAEAGNLTIVELLLAHGADPNEDVDSTSDAASFAATPEIRALIESHGTAPSVFDPGWAENDDALRRFAADPRDTYRI